MPLRAANIEKRRDERSTGLEVVEIGVPGSDDRHIGIIRDRSDNGARIQVRGVDDLPRMIVVYSPSSDDGVPARVCWQRGRDVGIRYRKR